MAGARHERAPNFSCPCIKYETFEGSKELQLLSFKRVVNVQKSAAVKVQNSAVDNVKRVQL